MINFIQHEDDPNHEVVFMSPEEYYQACADLCWPHLNVTVKRLKYERGERNAERIEELKNIILATGAIDMPYIDYTK
jgi:hypothetical protein